jgi:predicted TIM-barrel fold metal-dependent hydrolase
MLSALLFLIPNVIISAEIPIIDAHSQVNQNISINEIIPLMDKAGVSRVILAARERRATEDIIALAKQHPNRIIPAVRTKGGQWEKKKPEKFKKFVKKQLKLGEFGGMAELLLFHREKVAHTKVSKSGEKKRPPKVVVYPDEKIVKVALDIVRKKKWPFIAHIEFVSTKAERDKFMNKFENLLSSNPDHPFVLNHMGQLKADEVERLINAHKNIYFITASASPKSVTKSTEPWTNMFSWYGSSLSGDWEKLIIKHPERFILGLDNVWAKNWRKRYAEEIKLWKNVIKKLPEDVAHAFAHGNAERLWRLSPTESKP